MAGADVHLRKLVVDARVRALRVLHEEPDAGHGPGREAHDVPPARALESGASPARELYQETEVTE